MEGAVLMGRGMLFHSLGASNRKGARSPLSLCLDRGMVSNPKSADLRDLEVVWWVSRLLM